MEVMQEVYCFLLDTETLVSVDPSNKILASLCSPYGFDREKHIHLSIKNSKHFIFKLGQMQFSTWFFQSF